MNGFKGQNQARYRGLDQDVRKSQQDIADTAACSMAGTAETEKTLYRTDTASFKLQSQSGSRSSNGAQITYTSSMSSLSPPPPPPLSNSNWCSERFRALQVSSHPRHHAVARSVHTHMNPFDVNMNLDEAMQRNNDIIRRERHRGFPSVEAKEKWSPSLARRIVNSASTVMGYASAIFPSREALGRRSPIESKQGYPGPQEHPTGIIMPGEAVTTYVGGHSGADYTNSGVDNSQIVAETSRAYEAIIADAAGNPAYKARLENNTLSAQNQYSSGSDHSASTEATTGQSAKADRELDLSYLQNMDIEDTSLWPTNAFAQCSACRQFINKMEGVVLRNCRKHRLCKPCLLQTLDKSRSLASIPCPVPSCQAILHEVEVDALVFLHRQTKDASSIAAGAAAIVSPLKSGYTGAATSNTQMVSPLFLTNDCSMDTLIAQKLADEQDVQLVVGDTICHFCDQIIKSMNGAVLKKCHHALCKECLTLIKRAKKCVVTHCGTPVSIDEIEAFEANSGTPYRKIKTQRDDEGFQTVSYNKKKNNNNKRGTRANC